MYGSKAELHLDIKLNKNRKKTHRLKIYSRNKEVSMKVHIFHKRKVNFQRHG